MNRIAILLICIFGISINLFADNICSEFLSEAKQNYNNGNYQKAKEGFEYVKRECGESYGSVNDWIQLCDEKLNRTKTTQSASNYTSVYLSVSPISLNFSAKGGTKTISVSSSSGFNVSTNNYWIKYRKNDYSIDITIDENFNSSVRDGSIKITNYDGKSVSIAIRQQKKLTSAQLTSSPLYLEFEANGGTKALTITSSSSFSVETDVSWLTYSKSDDYVYVTAKANSYSVKRNGMIKIQNSDGKTISVSISQKANVSASSNTSSISSYSDSKSLSVSSTYIYSSYSGSIRYLTVTSNTEWELLYPTGSMYSVSRSGNQLTIYIHSNSYNESRKDFFKVITKDGSKEVKVTMEQGANTSARTSSTSKTKKTTSYNSNLTAYQKYIQNQDNIEITWLGFNTSLCTGYELGVSLLRLRFGWFQLKLYEMSLGYDFVSGRDFVAYNPSVNFLIPTGYEGTFYFGAGPTINTLMWDYDWWDYDKWVWFNAELGYRWHWGDWASSDFFMRYDGMFTIGVSIQWSSYF